uniref:Uncharacterized protein n=1 Tax=Stomoxys calcitrans TaxID=35570 RepID=A0A1I8QAE2_STOCA
MKLFAAFLLVAFIAHSKVALGDDVLRCYSCDGDDCDDADNWEIETCYSATTENPETTTTDTKTTETTTDTTNTGTITTTVETTTDVASTTDTTTTEPSPTTTTGMTTTVTTDTTTLPTDTTTVPTDTTTVPMPTDTTAVPTDTTAVPTDTTAVPTDTTAVPTDTTAGPTETALFNTKKIVKKRSASEVLLRHYRGRSRRATGPDGTGYACYTIEYKDNESSDNKMKKGCVKISVDQTACEAISDNIMGGNAIIENCQVCMSDKCNSSATLQFSLLTMAVLLLMRFFI